MVNISEPYVIHYPRKVAVADDSGSTVELIEFFDCVGGAMWSKFHYAQSPLVQDVRCVGSSMRYALKTGTVDLALEGSRFPAGISACTVDGSEIAVTYIGMVAGVWVQRPAVLMLQAYCGVKAIQPVGEKLPVPPSGFPGCSGY